MKKNLLLIVLVSVFCKVYSQTSSRSAATVITNRTLVGFNAMNTIQPGQDWNSIVGAGTFIPKLIEMNPATLRYPGGTVANWFKISPGEFILESDPVLYDETNPLSLCYGFPKKYSAVTGLILNELNGFETAIDNTFAHPLMVVNALTSDLASQLAMLEEARITGLPVNFVELGNEYYHDECETVTMYQDGIDYATKMLDWVSALRTRFTAVEIAGIGATANPSDPPRRQAWNTQAATVWTTPGVANPEASTLHHYAGIGLPNTTGCEQIDCSFDWPKMFLAPYTQYVNEIAQQITNINGTSLVPFDIWFTEYNMKNKTYYSHGSWGHALFTGLETLIFLSYAPNNVSLARHIDLNNMYGDATASAIFSNTLGFNFLIDIDNGESRCTQCPLVSTNSNTCTAEGIVFREIASAMKNCVSFRQIDFTAGVTPPMLDDGTTPAIVGYSFKDDAGNEQSIILNLSDQQINLTTDFANADYITWAFPGTTNGHSNDLNAFIAGEYANGDVKYFNIENSCTTSNLTKPATLSYTTGTTLGLPRWSITRLTEKDDTKLSAYALNSSVCTGEPVRLIGVGNVTTLTNLQWTLDGSTIAGVTTANYLHTGALSTGTHTFVLTNTSLGISSGNVTVTVNSIPTFNLTHSGLPLPPSVTICEPGDTYTIDASNAALSYTWVPANEISGNFLGSSIIAAPDKNTIYTVYGTDGHCVSKQTVTTEIGIDIELGDNPRHICNTSTFTNGQGTVLNTGLPCNINYAYSWIDGINPAVTSCTLNVPGTVTNTTYTVTVTHNNCTATASIQVIADRECCMNEAGTPAKNIYINSPVDENGLANLVIAKCAGCVTPATPTTPLIITGNGSFIDHIYLLNTLTVKHHLSLRGIDIIAAPGSEIKVAPLTDFRIDEKNSPNILSHIYTCDKLWKGIRTGKHSGIYIKSGSIIEDAEYSLNLGMYNTLRIDGSTFNNNYVSIYQPPVPTNTLPPGLITNVIDARIHGNTFKSNGNLKSAYTGQTTIPGTKPYSGMLINEAVLTVGVIGQNANQFGDPSSTNNMNNGVLSFKTALDVVNSKFNNIQQIDKTLFTNLGIGILNNNKNSFGALYQRGDGLLTYSFKDCYRAVFTLGAGVDIKNNRVEATNFGFTIAGSPNVNSIIENNRLYVFQLGVGSISNHFINSFHLYTTNIDVSGVAIPGFPSVGAGVVLSEHTTSVNFIMHAGQTVNMGADANYGAFLSGVQGAFINCATVNNNSDYNTDNFALFNSDYNTLYNNSANGTSIDISNSFHLMKSRFNTIDCNRSSATAFGFLIEDDCSMGLDASTGKPYFRANEIYSHHEGLRINSNGLIADQEQSGNKWLGSYGSLAAKNLNTNAAGQPSEFFYIQHSQPSGYFPNSNLLLPQSNWFIFNNSQTDKECEYLPCWIAIPLNRDSAGNYENTVALDTLHTADYEHEINYEARQALIEKLFSHPELLSNYIYYNFYASYLGSEMIEFARIEDTLRRVYILDSLLLKQVTVNDSIIKTRFAEINIFDSLYMDSISYSLIRDEKVRQVSACLLQNQTIMQQINEIRDIAVAYAKFVNNSINTGNELIAENRKAVTAIYLDREAVQNSDYAETEIAILKNIAVQCPFSVGKPVLEARRILLQISDTIYWDDSTTCAAEGYYRMMLHNDEKMTPVFVSPNPAKDNITIFYPFEKEKNYEIEIHNSIGQRIELITVPLNSSQVNISTNSYSEGHYSFKIVENNNITTANGKFVVIK